jgi:hypothetical protein
MNLEGGTKVIINETLEGLKLAYVVLGDKIEGGGQIKFV